VKVGFWRGFSFASLFKVIVQGRPGSLFLRQRSLNCSKVGRIVPPAVDVGVFPDVALKPYMDRLEQVKSPEESSGFSWVLMGNDVTVSQ